MSNTSLNAQSQKEKSKIPTEKEATIWFRKREWLNGANIKPHKSINKLEFAAQYNNHKERWDKAFAYIKNTDLSKLNPGIYTIDGENVFAIVAEANKKNFEATKWESHRKYQDIQMVISGKEKMGVAEISALTVTEPYDETKDILFYSAEGEGKYYLAEPGTFFIFFPQDGHRPDIKVRGYTMDKKIVIKVKRD